MASNPYDLLFLGDSITESFRWIRASLNYWNDTFSSFNGARAGISSDGIQHMLYRIENGHLEVTQPKVLALLGGTNNIPNRSAEEVAAGMTHLVYKIKELSPNTEILLLGIFPRGNQTTGELDVQLTPKLNAVNASYEELASYDSKIHYLNINSEFLSDDGQQLRTERYNSGDGVHLNHDGRVAWGQAILPKVQELLAK